jgi:hypothetical protein
MSSLLQTFLSWIITLYRLRYDKHGYYLNQKIYGYEVKSVLWEMKQRLGGTALFYIAC